jgi:hypothetical protein
MHESLSVDHVREARKALLYYCLDEKHCQKYLNLLDASARLIAKSRIADLAWEENYQGIDAPLFAVIRRLSKLYSEFVSGKLVVVGDSMLVRILSSVTVDGVEYEAGDAALIDIHYAVRLIASGLAEPVESNIIKLLAQPASRGS